jgi:type VI secretion system protein ImpH
MATAGRGQTDRLIDRLHDDPRRFGVFEAVRLIERVAQRTRRSGELGTHALPEREPLRFEGDPFLGFPSSEISALVPPPAGRAEEIPYRMRVAFMGLYGASGILPDFYTELLIQRRRKGDRALGQFLDLFVHRLVSLHYRAWKKYRVGPTIERSIRSRGEDPITTILWSIAGLGLPSLRDRMAVSDSVLIRFAGHLAVGTRSASRLRRVLEAHFGFGVEIEEFHGTWRYLPDEDRSRLPDATEPKGRYVTLGKTALVGRRVWDAMGSFRLRLGPLTRAQYDRLLPGKADALALRDLVRIFVGPTLGFDAVLLIRRDRLPAAHLAGSGAEGCHLGWNAWLGGGRGSDIAASVFALDATPSRR